MIDFDRKGLARIERIKDVIDHPNADRLDIVTINEWQCVAQKGIYQKDDFCLYFEIDSILPEKVESAIFGPDAKVKLSKSRVKTIKLRGAISQGLTCPINVMFPNTKRMFVAGMDLTKELGIGKYVPEVKSSNVLFTGARKPGTGNQNFGKMRKPAHLKTVGGFDDKLVFITEKIHGTSFVCGYVEREGNSLLKKINKALFGKYQFCYRSMNTQLQPDDSLWANIKRKFGRLNDAAHMEKTLYGRIARDYDLKHVLSDGQIVTGEIYGSGVQSGYAYGCAEGEQKFVMFGLRQDGVEACPEGAFECAEEKGLPFVPVLYVGFYNSERVAECTVGNSVLDPKTKVREGCVVNTADGSRGWHGNALVKNINPKYLLGNQTEFN